MAGTLVQGGLKTIKPSISISEKDRNSKTSDYAALTNLSDV